MTEEQLIEARAMLVSGIYTPMEVATEFGVTYKELTLSLTKSVDEIKKATKKKSKGVKYNHKEYLTKPGRRKDDDMDNELRSWFYQIEYKGLLEKNFRPFTFKSTGFHDIDYTDGFSDWEQHELRIRTKGIIMPKF